MTKLDRRALLAATAAAALLPAWGAQPQRREWPRSLATPPVRLATLAGAAWPLADAPGQALLLNFWASWCDPCRDEMPSLEELGRREAANGLRVVAANYRESDTAIRKFLADSSLALPVVRDLDGSAAKAFGIHAFPSTVAIDRHGRTRFIVFGECDWRSARSVGWVDELLAAPRRRS